MSIRFQLEEDLKRLVGGASPSHRSTIVYEQQTGWRFEPFDETIVEIIEDGPDEDSGVEGAGLGPHNHDDRYYTEDEVNTLIASVASSRRFTFALMGS